MQFKWHHWILLGGSLAACSLVAMGTVWPLSSQSPTQGRRAKTALSSPVAIPASSDASAEVKQSLDETLLFLPSKYPDGDWKPAGMTFEDASFESDDGVKLHGWYFPHDKPRAILLHAHGNAGNLTHRAWIYQQLQEMHRVSVLGFDYRGYGRSEGIPTADGIMRDGRAARAWLAQRAGIPESDIVLVGRSLGGAVAVQLAAEGGARGLILESVFPSLAEVAAYHYPPLLVSSVVPKERLNSAAIIAQYQGPLLQSHGDADSVIPMEFAEQLFELANEPKQLIRFHGLDHNDAQPPEYFQAFDRFLTSLPPASTDASDPGTGL